MTMMKFEMYWGGGGVVLNIEEFMTSLWMLGAHETRASTLNIPKLPRESSLGVWLRACKKMPSPCYVRYFLEISRAQLVGAKILLHKPIIFSNDHSSSICWNTWHMEVYPYPLSYSMTHLKKMYFSSIKKHTIRLGYWVYRLQSMDINKWINGCMSHFCPLVCWVVCLSTQNTGGTHA